MKTTFLLMMTCVLLAATAFGGSRAPLPATLSEAKTLYFDNRTGSADLGDNVYDELKKWGRYEIVNDLRRADLIFMLTTQKLSAESLLVGNLTSCGGVAMSESTRSSGTTYLTIFDANNGQQLWANSQTWGRHKSATRGIIKDLKDRMKEPSKWPCIDQQQGADESYRLAWNCKRSWLRGRINYR